VSAWRAFDIIGGALKKTQQLMKSIRYLARKINKRKVIFKKLVSFQNRLE